MAYQQTGDGFGAHEWVTIKGPDVYQFLSDGTCLQLIAENDDAPSYWSAEWVDVQGQVHDDFHPDHFPIRAGALEWARAWVAKRGVTTVPSDEQKAAPYYRYRSGGEEDRARQFHTPPGRAKEPTGPYVEAELAKALEMAQAIDMAMKIDAMMKAPPVPALLSPTIDDAVDCPTCHGHGHIGHPDDPAGKCSTCNGSGAIKMSQLMASIDAQMHPTYECRRCRSTFGTPSCPECGGVAHKVE